MKVFGFGQKKMSKFLIKCFNRVFCFHSVAQNQKIKCICALTHGAILLGSLCNVFLVFSATGFNQSVHLLNGQWDTSALLLCLPTGLPEFLYEYFIALSTLVIRCLGQELHLWVTHLLSTSCKRAGSTLEA